MTLPARVEDLASIVDTCKLVLALRNLEVDPVQTLGPLLYLHQLFSILLPWFRPSHQLWIFRLRVLNKIDSIVMLQRVHQHTRQNCRGCEGPNSLSQKWEYRGTALTNTPTRKETTNDGG